MKYLGILPVISLMALGMVFSDAKAACSVTLLPGGGENCPREICGNLQSSGLQNLQEAVASLQRGVSGSQCDSCSLTIKCDAVNKSLKK